MKTDFWRNKMLDTTKWESFSLSTIFEIKKGKRLTKENQTEGDTPFIGATARNNGITAYIGQDALHEGNTISITYNGSVGEAFYQKEPFWASDDVNVLYPKGFVLNEKIALFFCTILRHEKQMWSYARKWNLEQMRNTEIKLPVDLDKKPDFSYIESYMGSLSGDVSDIPDYFLSDGYEKACWYMDNINQKDFEAKYRPSFCESRGKKKALLKQKKYKLFSLDKLFKIEYPKTLVYANMQPDLNGINFVSSKGTNNGVVGRVAKTDNITIYPAGCITVPLKGSVLASSIQSEECYVAHQTAVLSPLFEMNIYVKIYIITLINANRFRFNYGRQADNTLKTMRIELPVDENEMLDLEYMENYIKSLPYSANI